MSQMSGSRRFRHTASVSGRLSFEFPFLNPKGLFTARRLAAAALILCLSALTPSFMRGFLRPAGAETFRIGVGDLAFAIFTHPRMRYFEPVSGRFLKAEMLAAAIERKERSGFRQELLSTMKNRQKTLLDNENALDEIRGLEKERDTLVDLLNELKTRIARRVESETRGLGQRDPERLRAEERVRREIGSGLEKMEKRLAEVLDRRRRLSEEVEDLVIARASSEVYCDPAESLKAVRTVAADLRKALERVKAAHKLSTIVNGSYLVRGSYLAPEGKAARETEPQLGEYTDLLRNDELFHFVAGGNLVPFSRRNLIYTEVTSLIVSELMEVCKAPPDYSAVMKRAAAALNNRVSPEAFDLDKRRGH